MEHSKQLITVLISLFIALSPLAECSFTYAESGGGGAGGDAWLAVTDNESMVAAFKAYCRTRNFNKTFTFSNGAPSNLAKAIINYDYDQIQKLCALAGTDIDTVNAGLWYKVDNNNILKFFYTSAAMRTLNQLYSALLTEHGIQENEEKELYSGECFQDNDGNYAYVFYSNSTGQGATYTKRGTYYKYVSAEINNKITQGVNEFTFNINSTRQITKTCLQGYRDSTVNVTYYNNSNNQLLYINGSTRYKKYEYMQGGFAIIRVNNTYYFGSSVDYEDININYPEYNATRKYIYTSDTIDNLNKSNSNITANQGEFNTPPENKSMEVQTDSDTINNFITNNNSNVTNNYYDDDNPPSPPPYTNPYDNNSTGGNIDGNGDFNFTMPDLNIDWNLDLGNNPPFPFSIPFDIINFMQSFNTEPVTPHIEETITIANMDIDIDIDLEWLDDVAAYFRTFILLSYIIGLIIATRALFHIY